MAHKVDYKKTLRQLYNPSIHGIHLVKVPKMNFLMVDGAGNPNTSLEYQQAIAALYTMSYGIKFAFKKQGYDHVVPPLEGLWWMENMHDFSLVNKDQWKWTMMIMQPKWVTAEWVKEALLNAMKKKDNPSLSLIRFDNFHEGLCVQTLYKGAYVDEAPTIAKIHEYIRTNGFMTNGKHHEIYLGDPRKTSPEKLLTILRQPIRKE
jgi:hypothetical protein